MNAFRVTIRTPSGRYTFGAIGSNSGTVALDALTFFGGLCGVSVVAL